MWPGVTRVLACGACFGAMTAANLPHGRGRLQPVPMTSARSGPRELTPARVSRDGRHVAFSSVAPLAPDDEDARSDVYVLDVATGALTRESAVFAGRSSSGDSHAPAISADGRWIVFVSTSRPPPTVMPDRTTSHVYLRDRHTGETTLVTETGGTASGGYAMQPAISADASTIVFGSTGTDIVAPTSRPNPVDVYLVRRVTGARERVSVATDGSMRRGQSTSPEVSDDGRYVVFMSHADLATPPDARDGNGVADVYLRDTIGRATRRISIGSGNRDANGPSYHPAISGDGRFVAFVSEATNLTRGTGKRLAHVYLFDVATGRIERITRSAEGASADGRSALPAIAADGSVVAFQSLATNLVRDDAQCGEPRPDTNMMWDVYRYERASRAMARLSSGVCAGWPLGGRGPSVNGRGDVVVFASRHPRDEHDIADDEDLFVWTGERSAPSPF